MSEEKLHIAMCPWFAMGHLTSHLHISNKLAERGHRISFFLPTKTQSKLQSLNLHPHLISFICINVPHVDGLPPGAETSTGIPLSLYSALLMAMDATRIADENSLSILKPHIVFFNFTHWIVKVAHGLSLKAVHFCIISPATVGFFQSPKRSQQLNQLTEATLMEPPLTFPSSSIKLRPCEARAVKNMEVLENGKVTSFTERLVNSSNECDANAFKTCREMEGVYCDYIKTQFKKPVILARPVVPNVRINAM